MKNFIARIRRGWQSLPNWFKSGVITLVGAFISLTATLSNEFLKDVATWFVSLLDEEPGAVDMPNVSVFANAVLAAGVALIQGVGFLVFRLIQAKTSFLGNPPNFNPPVNPDA